MNNYDVIIIGTGAGGGALAQRLAPSGKRILILERGTFLPQEKENWDTTSVFIENRYHTKEVWQDSEGKPLHPQTGYWVGGNTKVYGAALFGYGNATSKSSSTRMAYRRSGHSNTMITGRITTRLSDFIRPTANVAPIRPSHLAISRIRIRR